MRHVSRIKIVATLVFFALLFVAVPVFAADIFFGAKTNEVQIGEQFEIKLFVHTPEESVNAFEGKITFPRDLVTAREIRDGNSIINFWIDRPKAENGAIAFSGITPGGFQGNNGLLFSAVFEATSEGVADFEMNDAKVLRNDGAGSPAVLTVASFEMKISSETPAAPPAVAKIKDTEPPESFVPEIAKDATLFDGKWFIVFATQDKASGIDHYEVKESRQEFLAIFRRWSEAESPYVLQDQELRSYIFVKAVDKAGNIRVANITPGNPFTWYENYENWIMIIVGVFLFIIWYLWRRKLKH